MYISAIIDRFEIKLCLFNITDSILDTVVRLYHVWQNLRYNSRHRNWHLINNCTCYYDQQDLTYDCICFLSSDIWLCSTMTKTQYFSAKIWDITTELHWIWSEIRMCIPTICIPRNHTNIHHYHVLTVISGCYWLFFKLLRRIWLDTFKCFFFWKLNSINLFIWMNKTCFCCLVKLIA